MTIEHLRNLLGECPLVVSVQAPDNSALDDVDVIVRLARASLSQNVKLLRVEGVAKILAVRNTLGVPIIGLIKRRYSESKVSITPTETEVRALINAGCEVIAMDATLRHREGGGAISELLDLIRDAGRLSMADCDSIRSIQSAIDLGFDIVGTTLSGYTDESKSPSQDPDIDLVRLAGQLRPSVLMAEGRYSQAWQVQAALRAGADAVVVGGAINDPIKQTIALKKGCPIEETVAAFDIGGTWLRFALFDKQWKCGEVERIPLPKTRRERLEWMREKVSCSSARRAGISSGGTIDPWTGEVIESKASIPENVGTRFDAEALGIEGLAINDGLASAWAHACLPGFAGKRVATLALGTGIGCGLVDRGRIVMGPNGEYPRLNDVHIDQSTTLEEKLHLLREGPDRILEVVEACVGVMTKLWLPDSVVICGGAVASLQSCDRFVVSPFAEDAGLYGAAALALFPPRLS